MDIVHKSQDGDITKSLYVDDDGNAVIKKTQDHKAWIQRNRSIRETQTGTEFMHHIGFIPDSVIDLWKKEGIDIFDKNDMPKVLEKLASNEYLLLRTTERKL